MATHGGFEKDPAAGKVEQADWFEHVEEHHQRSSLNGLIFALFPLIAVYSIAAAFFGWWQ